MRRNGFQAPHDPRQILCTCIFLLDGLLFPILIRPFRDGLSTIVTTVFYISWIGAATTAMIITRSDPGKLRETDSLAASDYCVHCSTHVQPRSKHCWCCQKCVVGFDHHCPWLNNCIGEANYRFFVILVWLMIAMLGMLCSSMVRSLSEEYSVALVSLLVVNFPFFCLLIVLAVFHIFLYFKGITTYEYLKSKPVDLAPAAELELQESATSAPTVSPWDAFYKAAQAPTLDVQPSTSHVSTRSRRSSLPEDIKVAVLGDVDATSPTRRPSGTGVLFGDAVQDTPGFGVDCNAAA